MTVRVVIATPSVSILSNLNMGQYILLKVGFWGVNVVCFFICYRILMRIFQDIEHSLVGVVRALTVRLKAAIRNRLGLSPDHLLVRKNNFQSDLVDYFVKAVRELEDARKKFLRKSTEMELDIKRKYSVRVTVDRRKSARLSNPFGHL